MCQESSHKKAIETMDQKAMKTRRAFEQLPGARQTLWLLTEKPEALALIVNAFSEMALRRRPGKLGSQEATALQIHEILLETLDNLWKDHEVDFEEFT